LPGGFWRRRPPKHRRGAARFVRSVTVAKLPCATEVVGAREPDASVSHPTGAHLSWEGILNTNQYNAERVLPVR
jgi:hypothetical protein